MVNFALAKPVAKADKVESDFIKLANVGNTIKADGMKDGMMIVIQFLLVSLFNANEELGEKGKKLNSKEFRIMYKALTDNMVKRINSYVEAVENDPKEMCNLVDMIIATDNYVRRKVGLPEAK